MLPGSREDMVLRSGEEVRWPRQKSPRGSAGRRACRSYGTRHLSKVPDQDVAPNGAPLPLWREKEIKAAPRALLTPGADESRLRQCRRDALNKRGLFDM